ncbi:MAG: DUF4097 family beta strand repeat-containing protein [Acidobacteriota bacterium]
MRKHNHILLAAGFVLMLALPVVAFSATETSHTERSFAATTRGSVTIDASFHSVEVTARPGATVDVVVDLEFSASKKKAERLLADYEPRFKVNGDDIVIRSTREKSTWSWGWDTSKGRITVLMPPGMDLMVDNSSGAVLLQGDFGDAEVTVDNSSGSVKGETAMAALSIDNSSGRTDIKALRPLDQFQVDCSSGSVHLEGGAFRVKVDSSSGSVELDDLLGETSVDTSSGSVKAVWQSIPPGAEVRIDTSSGEVRLGFPQGTEFNGEIDTSSGGIRSDFPGAKEKSNCWRFEGGSGAVQLTVDTSSGGVRLSEID